MTTQLQAIAETLQEDEPSAEVSPVIDAVIEEVKEEQVEETPATLAVSAQSILPLEAANEEASAPEVAAAITNEPGAVIESGLQAIVETLQAAPSVEPAPKAKKVRKSKKRITPPDNEAE